MEGRIKSLIHNGRRHLPLPTGPYTVGCCDIMTSYLRFGVFVRLYYPTKGVGILDRYLQWPSWIPHKNYINGYASRMGLPPRLYQILFKAIVGELYIPALWQSSLHPSEETYPVVVFSHGLSGWRTAYASICLELASYGFVVAAVEHRDYSASASFYKKKARMSATGKTPGICLDDLDGLLQDLSDFNVQDVIDGKWDPGQGAQDLGPFCHANEWMLYQRPTKGKEPMLRSRQVRYRARECAEALDLLEDLNKGRFVVNVVDPNFDCSMFHNQLNLKQAFFIGHSFGGSTGILCTATELRFKAAVLLDPWMYPFYEDHSSFSAVSQPFLCLAIESFQTKKCLQLLQTLHNLHSQSSRFYVLKDAEHRDVCDIPFIKKFSFSLSAKIGSRISRFSVHDLACDLILQYLGEHIGKSLRKTSEGIEFLKKKYLRNEDYISELLA